MEGILMPLEQKSSNIWLTEHLSAGETYQYLISKIITQQTSDYQDICIVELENKSKALILNNKLQPTTFDEHMYFEPFVHIPFIHFKEPESILILGAGEGAIAREVLKWKSVKKINIVERDKLIVDSCSKYLPEINKGSFKNSKVKIFYKDVNSFISQDDNKYDVIFYNLQDPLLEEKNKINFNKKLLLDCKSLLNKNGLMCLQMGDSPIKKNELFIEKIKLMKSIFRSTKIYSSWIPSICKNLSFVLMNKDKLIESMPFNDVDMILQRQLLDELIFVNAKTFIGLMNPPKYIQEYDEVG
ncbi:methyltransferase [Silvanigrella paludirubra]|uniref:Polyamine aminopropyltransferase n=2 Tax=Silvanigrella paludirubra TaxID=2499159 RepID=A0A6N6VT04_9BACT|nr:methyltransferase [Silvanigrella paludirubra]